MLMPFWRRALPGLVVALTAIGQVQAHEIVGNRFFPATLNIDDPGVNDELVLLRHKARRIAPFKFACTTRTSRERSCDCYYQVLMERRDRVRNVTLGSDRRRRGVGNDWERQVF